MNLAEIQVGTINAAMISAGCITAAKISVLSLDPPPKAVKREPRWTCRACGAGHEHGRTFCSYCLTTFE